MMSALQDEETQLRGIVCIGYEMGGVEQPTFDFELLRREMYKMKCLPLKIVGGHFCTENNLVMQALDLIIHMATPFFRVRSRYHFGTYPLLVFPCVSNSVGTRERTCSMNYSGSSPRR